ncbi:hypothetical protein BCR33DRAFT_846281 [Rhizoclosmatium globosum]|uniref:Uncharacterized protein n=1 Tax=Rhizoclosmatium globosum TaxID=329046 RepID=A0A1Y2CWU0_9FUNG|nr:hypothetical protein BCR33DRAFT_846281 [Rhizoclosmatium globosum]|eukprot:ORY51498.1 hypothetical protein BCR33DRAFT_846281 [Rhizoclosmatium globosum]
MLPMSTYHLAPRIDQNREPEEADQLGIAMTVRAIRNLIYTEFDVDKSGLAVVSL